MFISQIRLLHSYSCCQCLLDQYGIQNSIFVSALAIEILLSSWPLLDIFVCQMLDLLLVPNTRDSYQVSWKFGFQTFGFSLTTASLGSVASAFTSGLTDSCVWCGGNLNIRLSYLSPTPTQSSSGFNFTNLVPLVSTSTRIQVPLYLQSEFFPSVKKILYRTICKYQCLKTSQHL